MHQGMALDITRKILDSGIELMIPFIWHAFIMLLC